MLSSVAFTGDSLNHLSVMRKDPKTVESMYKSDKARFVLFSNSRPLCDQSGSLCFLSRQQMEQISASALPQSHEARHLVLLGASESTPYFALGLQNNPSVFEQKNCQFQDVRSIMAVTPHGSLIAQAKALLSWHEEYRFCSRCGSETIPMEGGTFFKCSDTNPLFFSAPEPLSSSMVTDTEKKTKVKGCSREHYPRVDPVVIMAIESCDQQRLLLGSRSGFPESIFTCVAGFIEVGETIEAACRREAFEEAGIKVGSVKYVSSQPWPYKGSQLMIGCIAQSLSEETQLIDGELTQVKWFQLKDVQEALSHAKSTPVKEFWGSTAIRTAPPGTIAFALIEHWASQLASQKQ